MKIAPNLEIGPGAVTDTFAAIGTRGSGKTYLEIIVDHADGAISAAPELFDGRA